MNLMLINVSTGVKRQIVLRDKATHMFASVARETFPCSVSKDHSLVPTWIELGAARRCGP